MVGKGSGQGLYHMVMKLSMPVRNDVVGHLSGKSGV
jgi:hypothetical protein